MRRGSCSRKTNETDIFVEIGIEGTGTGEICSGIGFFDHMLTSFKKHSGMDLTVKARGDLSVSPHHTIEDIGICLGKALREAVGEGRGIRRFGHAVIPMDEALATVAIDYGGRPYFVLSADFSPSLEGQIPGFLIGHYFESCSNHAGMTLHMHVTGTCDHHKCEALFKAFGRALADALRTDGSETIPSTKGTY